jgi:hypothetical protein
VESRVKIVLVVSPVEDDELARLHRDFHLAAGVDAVIPNGANDGAADWLIESEPTEFWWPHASSLKEILEPVSERYGLVDAVARRIVGRKRAHRLMSDATPVRKSVRRAGGSPRPLRGWYPIEVLRLDRQPLDDEELERGVAEGALVEDTRLRDALETLTAGGTPVFRSPTLVEEACLAADIAALGDADVVAAQRRLDELEERLAAIESLAPFRIERRLRDAVRRRR